jgi:hypothetical protein
MLDGFMVGIFTILLFLYYMSHRRRLIVKDILAGWFLFLPSIAAISMYLLIHVEIRYLAPFIVLFCLALYSSVRLPVAPRSKQVFSFATIVILVIFVLAITPSTANGAFTSLTDLIRHRDAQRNTYWQVAHGLDKIGIRPGDQVASVGGSITSSKWARLAKVKIVAEIYSFNDASAPPNDDEEKFWASDPSVKEQVMQAFAKAGAKAVITVSPPEYANLSGWQRVDGSSFYVHFLE